MNITIGYLYGDCMNIYGDIGNIICLQKRARWRDISVTVKVKSIKDRLKIGECDIYFFGGGQDQAQELVARDLVVSSKGKIIKQEVEKGVPLLSICGGYQLLGDYYQPFAKPKLKGVGLFPAYTEASHDRMIGNIIIELNPGVLARSEATKQSDTEIAAPFGLAMTNSKLVGFENHSGKTYFKEGAHAQSLGKVIKGFGNNGEDHTEGCVYKNAIGCYMHGPLLPKNPQLADWLLQKALETKYDRVIKLEPLDDTLEKQAHLKAVRKFS